MGLWCRSETGEREKGEKRGTGEKGEKRGTGEKRGKGGKRGKGRYRMKLSARNQFRGTVTKIKTGEVMGEVTVNVGSIEVVAAITMGSVKSMALKVKDKVTVAVKATEVLVVK